MKIKSVEFAGAVARPGGPVPGDLPQVVFAGRSNVGKSSLINRLLGRTRTPIARVSGTPGKTQEINFYRVRAEPAPGRDLSFFVVDLPGYGWARAPAAVRAAWQPLIETYLSGTPGILGVVQLVDIRHEPAATDRQMLAYLASLQLPVVVVLTKSDKLSAEVRARRVGERVAELGVPEDQVIPFSARSGDGREALLGTLARLLSGARG